MRTEDASSMRMKLPQDYPESTVIFGVLLNKTTPVYSGATQSTFLISCGTRYDLCRAATLPF